jgi:hypothetical protein
MTSEPDYLPSLPELIRASNRLKAEADVLLRRAQQIDKRIAGMLKNQLGENWVAEADQSAR